MTGRSAICAFQSGPQGLGSRPQLGRACILTADQKRTSTLQTICSQTQLRAATAAGSSTHSTLPRSASKQAARGMAVACRQLRPLQGLTSAAAHRRAAASWAPARRPARRAHAAGGSTGGRPPREDEVWAQLGRLADKYLLAGGEMACCTRTLFTDAAWRQLSFYLSCGRPPRRRPISKPEPPPEHWQPAAPASTSHTRAPVLLHCCMAADNSPSQQQRATDTPQAAVTRPDQQQQQQLGCAAAVPAHRRLEQQQQLSAGTQPFFWLHVWAGGGEHREQQRTVAHLPDVCSRWAVVCVTHMRLRTGVAWRTHLRATAAPPWRVLSAQAPPTTLTSHQHTVAVAAGVSVCRCQSCLHHPAAQARAPAGLCSHGRLVRALLSSNSLQSTQAVALAARV